jgi:RNA polymerase sigma-70 factor (ECF subfamily)
MGPPSLEHDMMNGQPRAMNTSPYSRSEKGTADARTAGALTFDAVYDEYVDFVWRSLRRLGVSERAADDLAQEVFLVVHRRLHEWEGRASLKTWLFAIVLGIVRNHRRAVRRKDAPLQPLDGVDGNWPPERSSEHGPHAAAQNAEARHILYALLERLDDDKRAVFVLAELEQLTVPEIAEALGVNANTIYTRLRAARMEFDQALARYRARERRAG